MGPASFEQIRSKWLPEIEHHCPSTPFILVGTKSDLRNDPETIKRMTERKLEVISTAMGTALAKQINASGYYECSSLTQEGLKGVIDSAIRVALSGLKKKKKKNKKKSGIENYSSY